MRHARLNALLLTKTAFATANGTPGIVFTAADATEMVAHTITIAGPVKLGLFMNALVSYGDSMKNLQLDVKVHFFGSALDNIGCIVVQTDVDSLVPFPVVVTSCQHVTSRRLHV